MTAMITALCILLAAVADRVRGGWPSDGLWLDPLTGEEDPPLLKSIFRQAMKFSYGAALAGAAGLWEWRIVVGMAVGWKFGEQLAGDFGSTFRLIRKSRGWLPPLLRVGLVWPLLCLPLACFDMRVLALWPASVLGVVASAVAARWLPLPSTEVLELRTPAGWQELLRGGLTAAGFAVMARAWL